MRVSNAIQERVSGYFLGEEIVNYLEVKKCSESCCCAAVGSRNRISTAKSGLKDLVHQSFEQVALKVLARLQTGKNF